MQGGEQRRNCGKITKKEEKKGGRVGRSDARKYGPTHGSEGLTKIAALLVAGNGVTQKKSDQEGAQRE